jgi:hypothetical protein
MSKILNEVLAANQSYVHSLPIRLSPTPTTYSVSPFAGI